ncbi:MAG: hypothetical protein M0P01_11555 [Treponema sp.]|nr:hypothetical protein [Treponema sp.]
MSYSKSVHGSVSYSETVSMSYPASEHGGSVSKTVSGSIPVDIMVHVDTAPFDRSVDRCNGQIKGLSGSVVAMNAAQCAVIRQRGSDISAHVTNGFFTLIKSEISQDMASLFSRINSGIGLILEKTKQVKKQQLVMQDDYSRTKTRYVKIFSDLDEECRRSIVELDKKAFELSQHVQHEQLFGQESKQTAFLVTGANDGSIVNQQLSTASLYSKTAGVLQDLAKNVNQQLIYAHQLDSILYKAGCEGLESVCIPVVYAELSDMSSTGTKNAVCYVSRACEGKEISEQITKAVQKYFTSQSDGWGIPGKTEEELVTASFNKLAEKMLTEDEQRGNTDGKRIYDMIMQLRSQSGIKVNHE